MFKLCNEKENLNDKNKELNSKVIGLENSFNNIQSPINSNSNIIDNMGKNTGNNVENSNQNKNNNSSINESVKKVLYEYSSGDNNAAKGNPEILKIYELNDSQIEFNYHAVWNSNDIKGIATKSKNNVYTYKNNNISINFTFNMNDNSVKVEEYKDSKLTGSIELWK